MPRWAKVVLGTLAGVLVILTASLLFLTQTDAGRERVRRFVSARLQASAHGLVKVGPVSGSLLTGARIGGLVITDSTGAPFFRADTVVVGYSLLPLLRRRVELREVRLVRPVVVLDRPPGLAWNFSRIFPSDTTQPPTRQGFGAWVAVRGLDVVGGRVLVRNEWLPPDSLRGAARDSAVAAALSAESRQLVVRVPRGFQSIQDYQRIDGRFDRLRLAHPDSAAMVFDVGRLSLLALPFRPPAADVREMAGRVVRSGDTIRAEALKLAFPGTRATLDGSYDVGNGNLRASVVAPQLALADLRWAYPPLPEQGGGSLRVGVARRGERTRVVAREMDLAVERARLAGHFDVTFGDSLRLGPSDVRFAALDTRLIQRLAPAVEPPRHGTLDGRLALAGRAEALRVDGDVAFTARGAGTSRVFADGMLGTGGGGFTARGLRLRFDPVQLALVSAAGPDLPVGGAITGSATLTGSTRQGFDFRADLAHRDAATGRSRVLANGAVVRGRGGYAARDLRVRLDPLQVALARAFRPDLPVGGTVTGTATLDGRPEELRLAADLVHRSGPTGRSRLVANGGVAFGDVFRARDLRLRFDPVQLALARAFRPDLALGGVVQGTARLDGTPADMRLAADLVHASAGTGRSRLVANGGVGFGETFRARDLRLRFDPVQVALARAFRPDLALGGVVEGTARLSGTQADMRVAADLVHASVETGRSHVTANGAVGFGEAFRARDLRLAFDPLQTALVRAFDPDLPLAGYLSGGATLNGSTASRFAVSGDVTHEAPTGRSRLVGDAAVPLGGSGRLAVDVRALPLSLETVGRFAPAAQLHGSASGSLRATGTMRDLAFSLGMAVEQGGRVDADGRLDLASAARSYDVRARFAGFDPHAVSLRAPETQLTGSASAAGRGTDPATMSATLAADLTGARVGSTEVDSVRLLARLAGGLATVERGAVRLGSALAEARGSFGLVAGRSGTLDYRVRVDTLARFAALLPADSGRVRPRPAVVARAVERARADSLRIARATEVERAATGRPAEPTLRVDTAQAIARDSLSGSLDASGTVAGNVERFDLRGTAAMRELVAFGSSVGNGRVAYTWLNAPTPRSDLALDAQLDRVRAGGFDLDSVAARVRYAGTRATGDGTVDLLVRQDPQRDYRATAAFALSPARSEVRYSDLALRFDTTTWRAARPGVVSWAGSGVEVRDVELLGSNGGRIAAEGRVPTEGPADLRLAVDRLQVGDVLALVQDSTRVRGLLTLDAQLRGTARSPVISATAGLVETVVDTVRVPDARARFAYADRVLRGDAELAQAGRVLLAADGSLPVNLAISGVEGPRFAADAPLALDVRADSLPLEALPSFTDAVSDVRGRLVGSLAVRGTRAAPDVRGVVDLDLGSLRVEQAGVRLEDVAGTIRVAGDTAVIDSLSARSRRGTIRVAGGLDLATLTQPGFDLDLTARDARVLDNERGKVEADADLALNGPWTAARVSGGLRVRRGVIYAPETRAGRRIDIDAPSVTALGDTAALRLLPVQNPLLANLRVDVDVSIAPDTWVRNSAANVQVYTPAEAGALTVNMDRATQALTLRGTINTDRGEYTFAGRRIRLTQGSVIFLGQSPIDPILQLKAEQEVRLPNRPAFAIQLLVGGTLQEPRLTLQSNAQPPVSESDLLAYFAFGEPASSLLQPQTGGSIGGGTGGGGALLGPVGALATQQLGATAVGTVVDQFEQQAMRALNLDVLNVTPAPVPPELALQGYFNVFRGAQFEAGRYFGSRWFVAGQGRTAAVFPGVRVEYRTLTGFQWVTSLEPRYLPQQPSLTLSQSPGTASVFGVFLQWQRRF